ncbi:PHP domain-containing protein [Neomoorella thermoacetica]|uniref:PHP domain-containing protein n=1 Tax=Neomoorella thermoacetica TaxID=1525 RepID=UPI0008FB0A82|nr:PHP domain-containing protein [Moorella thermoacetica]OIQ61711.1 DNA polymerase III PolC-type [Moorella thermoacetica]
MVVSADLHTHTTASDGQLRPAKMVRLARERGLTALGITDHDTVSGLAEALAAGREVGLKVIPGIELSTEWEGREIHLLGYGLDWEQGELMAFLETMRQARQRRNLKIVARLRDLGYNLTMADVAREAKGETTGRPHIAAALVQKGYLPSIDAAFKALLDRGRPAYVPRAKIPPSTAVKVILEAGGVPVLAHPGLSQADDIIPALVNSGLQGLEVYYPHHDPVTMERYLKLASRYDLVVTGGSDFHGRSGDSHADLGSCTIGAPELVRLKERWQRIRDAGD